MLLPRAALPAATPTDATRVRWEPHLARLPRAREAPELSVVTKLPSFGDELGDILNDWRRGQAAIATPTEATIIATIKQSAGPLGRLLSRSNLAIEVRLSMHAATPFGKCCAASAALNLAMRTRAGAYLPGRQNGDPTAATARSTERLVMQTRCVRGLLHVRIVSLGTPSSLRFEPSEYGPANRSASPKPWTLYATKKWTPVLMCLSASKQ